MISPPRFVRTALHATVVASLALAAAPAAAATITVNSLADTTGGAECTLRDAVAAANTDMASGGCTGGSGSDTITFSVSGIISPAIPFRLSSTILIDGNGQQVVINGNDRFRMFDIFDAVTLQNLTASHAGEGAVYIFQGSLLVKRVVFSHNRGPQGAAIIAIRGTPLTVIESTFADNIAVSDGGAIYSLGPLRISDSTFMGNRAARGGAIAIRSARLDLFNSTLSGNSAVAGGGGIDGSVNPDIVILHSTIVGNRGSGVASDSGAILDIDNSILAGNDRDCGIEHFSGFHRNLIGDDSCGVGTGDLALRGDPMLGPLADNGGATATHALLPGSPAIDAGDGSKCATLALDQRGSPRSVDGNLDGTAVCDLGAFEYSRLFDFSGFLAPVDNLPTVNAIKAGRAVPVTFSLSGDQGLAILAPGSPSSQRITCDSGAPVSEVEQTATAGASALSYDAPTDTYTYVWKTDKAWAGTCRQLVVQLADGTFHLASFRIK